MSYDGSAAAAAQDESPPPLTPIDSQALACATCGYGIAAQRRLPSCPMCGGDAWEPARGAATQRLWDSLL